MAPKETAKKGALTLEKLALYDDILTDALVDKVGSGFCACAAAVATLQGTHALIGASAGLLLDCYQEEPWRPFWRIARTERGRHRQHIARACYHREELGRGYASPGAAAGPEEVPGDVEG